MKKLLLLTLLLISNLAFASQNAASLNAQAGAMSEWIDVVKQYGMCQGSDDTTAMLAAIATGKNIYIPNGCYPHIGGSNSGITLNNAEQIIQGAGRAQSGILCYNTSTSCITLSANHTQVRDMNVVLASGVTATAGMNLIQVTTNSSEFQLDNMELSGGYNGIEYDGTLSGGGTTQNIEIYNFLNAGMYINVIAPQTIGRVAHMKVAATSSGQGQLANIYIAQSDTADWIDIVAGGFMKYGILMDGTGVTGNQSFNHVNIENAISGSLYAIKIGDSENVVIDTKFTDVHLAPLANATGGIYVGTAASGTIFNNVEMYYSPLTYFLYDNGSVHSTYNAMTTYNPYGAAGATYLNGTNTIFTSNRLYGTSGTGFSTGSGATGAVISNNYFGGAVSLNAATTSSATTAISNNSGNLQDTLTSISAAPQYIGQKAVVSSVVYMSKGVSSTSDWLQISN